MTEREPSGGSAAAPRSALEIHYDDARAAEVQRARIRQPRIGALGFLLIGIAWLLLTALRPETGPAVVFTVLGYVFTGLFLLQALRHGIRWEQGRARPVLQRASANGPLLVFEEAGIRLDEGLGLLVPYRWEMVVLEYGHGKPTREGLVTLHIGGSRHLLAAAALSCSAMELLRSAAELRGRPVTR